MTSLNAALRQRFMDASDELSLDDAVGTLSRMAARGSCRAFADKDVPLDLLKALSAVALASPSKSDLQGRDIILIDSPEMRRELAALVSEQAWVDKAPRLAVICGNNRRQRLIHDWHGIPFANNHLDALFNAIGDAAIALGAFVTAAEAVGLGCCPISAVRNRAAEVSALLKLPDHVFPFAGLAIGYPAHSPTISPRLPLQVTCHVDSYSETDLQGQIERYDAHRADTQPFDKQRFPEKFGPSDTYSWSEDKARQYSVEERADFGQFIRQKGFNLT